MCGIVGWLSFTETLTNETEVIKEMANQLIHRVPMTLDSG
jgi:asparagine synthetase B (glutamine-hydrolysing)